MSEWHEGQWIQCRTDPLEPWIMGQVDAVLEDPTRLMIKPDDLGTTIAMIVNLHEWQVKPLPDDYDPMAPDYDALAAAEPTSQIEDSRLAAF